jgi:hypothetical protein
MSLARFVGTMRERALWFSRIDKLGDPWEASVSAETFDQVIALARTKARYQNREAGDLANEAEEQIRRFRRRTFVNCWSANEHESHALWRIYCNSTEGVAIQTSVGRLRDSLNWPWIVVQPVYYCEPGTRSVSPPLRELAFEKLPMYEYEREVRAVLTLNERNGEEGKERLGQGVAWNAEEIVDRVIVHPEADPSVFETVRAIVAQFAPMLN